MDSLIIVAVLVNVRILTNVLALVLVAIRTDVNKSLGSARIRSEISVNKGLGDTIR